MNALLSKKFGGTITLGCDPVLPSPRSLPSDALFFSHGRAAMIWIMRNAGEFQSAAVCAYTWPEIPRMMKRYNCEVGFFDFMQNDIVDVVNELPGRCYVIVPVFYGFLKTSIDYPEDYKFMKRVFSELYDSDNLFSLLDVIKLVKEDPTILEINATENHLKRWKNHRLSIG